MTKETTYADAQSKSTAYAYDALGQRTSMNYSDGETQSRPTTYRPAGEALETRMPIKPLERIVRKTFAFFDTILLFNLGPFQGPHAL